MSLWQLPLPFHYGRKKKRAEQIVLEECALFPAGYKATVQNLTAGRNNGERRFHGLDVCISQLQETKGVVKCVTVLVRAFDVTTYNSHWLQLQLRL